MPGHDFEKKVQQQMEGLHVTPSKTVWNRVEIEIRREKRRRRVLIALPFILLLIGGGIYLRSELNDNIIAISSEKQKNNNNDTKNSHPDPATTDVAQPGNSKQDPGKHDNLAAPSQAPPAVSSQETVAADGVKSKEHSLPSGTSAGKSSAAPTESLASSNRNERVRNSKIKAATDKSTDLIAAGPSTKNNTRKSSNRPVVKQENTVPGKTVIVADAGIDAAKTKKDGDALSKSTNVAQSTVSAAEEVIIPVNPPLKEKKEEVTANTADKAPDTKVIAATAKKKVPAKDVLWSWGVTGGAGVSRITSGGLFDAFGGDSKMMDAALFTGNTSFNPTPSGLPQQAAAIEPGFNWNAGVFVERTLNKKLSISAGLQYNYFSTYSDIGKRVDSQRYVSNSASTALQVDNYYRNGQNNRYVTSYHFIELPVTLHVRLGGNTKTSYYWNSGFSIAQLLSTNALHYDGQSGFYYADNSLFRKTQWSLHTELAIRLFSNTKHALEIGPHFYYQPSNLLKQTSADPQHLLSGGVKVRWYMGRIFQ